MSNLAQEYTPEMDKSYLDSLMTPIDDQGRVDEGRAMSEAAARGTLDQGAFIGSAIGQVRKGVADEKARTIGAFNLDVANKTRDERLMAQNRSYSVEDRNYGAAEAQKNRDFQLNMAQLGYGFQNEQGDKNRAFDPLGFAAGFASTAGSAAIGGYWGGRGRADGAASAAPAAK